MRTIIIAFAYSRNINQFQALPTSWVHKDTRFITHTDPEASTLEEGVVYNFDFLIQGDYTKNNVAEITPDDRQLLLRRDRKIAQHFKINQLETYYQYKLRSFYCSDRDKGVDPIYSDKVVVKPQTGARGLGTFILDLNKIKVPKFEDWLLPVVEDMERLSGDIQKAKALEALEDLKSDPVLANGVEYYSGTEDFPGEGIIAYEYGGWLVQDYVDNIISEYRVIAANGRVQYVQQRERNGEDFKQASGGGCISTKVIDLERAFNCLDEGAQAEFEALVKHLGPELRSIDLFKTPTQWGVFEYSNQYGHTGIPTKLHTHILKDYIYELTKDL